MLGMGPWLTFGAIVFVAFALMLTVCSIVGDWRRVQVAKHTGRADPVGSDE